MAYNFVGVTIAVQSQIQAPVLLQGELRLQPSDIIWDTSLDSIIFVEPLVLSANGNYTSPVTVPLLAMDNPSLSTNWFWVLSAGAADVSRSIPIRKLTVNYNLLVGGVATPTPTQSLVSLLAASTVLAA